jgi:hypothetical protein
VRARGVAMCVRVRVRVRVRAQGHIVGKY